ncbi:helix-turn-helix domain-containing protein [Phytoactinopolyspora endophytica]|uniref:helix-turn-helix domain-containing protein n=1 Tax=Phytoactinopolyspora endophytica TaxID=1642495 RepID=UPI00101D8A11|nr:helix-turn-helix domain-containing protein [Phytoactinopolyspora endophytica]
MTDSEDSDSALPDYMKHALEIVHEHPQGIENTADLARRVSVGERILQMRFKRHLGVSPTTYVKNVRLDRVREALLTWRPGGPTIDRISRQWGFSHYGQFAGEYRSRFGEQPSETLRRRLGPAQT